MSTDTGDLIIIVYVQKGQCGSPQYVASEKSKRKQAPHVPGKSPSPVLMWPATA